MNPWEAPPCKPLIPKLSREQFGRLSDSDQAMYLRLWREQIAPKMERWRKPAHIKCAYGGRGAGAKSRSAASLLIQFGENPSYFGERIRVLCCRKVQKSIAQSSWLLLKDTIPRLGYTDWTVTNDRIINNRNGSLFVFNGLNDMHKDDLKSYESFDILFIEEAAPIERDALLTLEATFRKPNAEIWLLFNRDRAHDPCYDLYCEHPDPSWSVIKFEPGAVDNPWFNDTNLPAMWERMRDMDPDEARHVFEGYPRTSQEKAVFTLAQVEAMRDRVLSADDEAGAVEIGCDVARYGKDYSVAWKRHGMRVTDCRRVHGFDTNAVAGMLWDMAGHDRSVAIKIDLGYNPGVADVLSGYGANVVGVNFGSTADDSEQYANAAAEMMFELPVDRISIPSENLTNDLVEDLSERRFLYDPQGRKKLEPKDGTNTGETGATQSNFKSRHGGRSPDAGDALCLAFYERHGAVCY